MNDLSTAEIMRDAPEGTKNVSRGLIYVRIPGELDWSLRLWRLNRCGERRATIYAGRLGYCFHRLPLRTLRTPADLMNLYTALTGRQWGK